VAGSHEPGSQGSFYLSLATAGLRFVLVIAAVVLGIFVLTRAFPTAGEQAPSGSQQPTVAPSPSPSPTESPAEDEGEEPPAEEQVQLEGVAVQVQNGSSTTGLAAETAERLQERTGVTIEEIGNASRNYETTTIFFQRGFRAEAEELRRVFFDGNAEIARASSDAAADVELIVVLGEDYAESQG